MGEYISYALRLSLNINMSECQTIVETPRRNVLVDVSNAQYVSPNANLKLLTDVALKSSSHRKEKSLQILCDRFLDLYPLNANTSGIEIQLDATAQKLGVEKRRIYDIINILEALQCATHCRKNTYTWHGTTKLDQFLSTLKTQGEALGISRTLHGMKGPLASPKHRSLGVLAQRFLMMFLVEPPGTLINLEMAVTVLISPRRYNGTSQSDRQHKSKVRRLYDISNVLSSIGLIEKVSGSTILKKPIFRYTGPSFISRKYSTPPISSLPLTPLTYSSDKYLDHSCPSKSKRKLIFSSPSITNPHVTASTCMTTPSTPSHKWDEILQVVNMELTRINGASA